MTIKRHLLGLLLSAIIIQSSVLAQGIYIPPGVSGETVLAVSPNGEFLDLNIGNELYIPADQAQYSIKKPDPVPEEKPKELPPLEEEKEAPVKVEFDLGDSIQETQPTETQESSIIIDITKDPTEEVQVPEGCPPLAEPAQKESVKEENVLQLTPAEDKILQTIPETALDEAGLKETPPVTELDPKTLPETQENTAQTAEDSYFIEKYGTLEGEAKLNEYEYSLWEPFETSLYYDVLKKNSYEDIELLTENILGTKKPEALVYYNVPMGGQGEFACQLMLLGVQDNGLSKRWVSELIPGKIDSVQVEDINFDGSKDIVAISTLGGVSLLKSIRVYSYDKALDFFKTVFAMNRIMEGVVDAQPGKILISETYPGGVNRAALYVWNGKTFERLEL